jgi:hypothetical protein
MREKLVEHDSKRVHVAAGVMAEIHDETPGGTVCPDFMAEPDRPPGIERIEPEVVEAIG